MSLIDQAKADIQQITSNADEFGVPITFEAPDGTIKIVIGLATKHHIGVNTDGLTVNSKHAHCSFSEKLLKDQNYPIRNAANEVAMVDHKVSWIDSAGNDCQYVIRETFPDETIGLIVCILADFQ